METTLEKCPCCGHSEAKIFQYYEEINRFADRPVWYVKCQVCGLRTANYDNKAQAIFMWNLRVDN